ncbi:histone acetyltransferase type b catalytic subunit [Anaeramoeba flamelloides]|uniref:histone acetyltransferase n=1 Tax=Anaeramoeba flamelloides TaxID=1746091 RepID=A0AAV8A3W9_9EUKA|nr:histone acetyltransferase type b catalytic subunit [Anaeramoeba flamelloides]
MKKSQNQKFLNPLPDCVSIILKRDQKGVVITPKYTQNIFGIKEQIFGYQNLNIYLSFSPSCNNCFVNYQFDSLLQNLSETDCNPYQLQQNVTHHLNEKSICASAEEFNNICNTEMSGRSNFVPPGECFYEFEEKNRKFAIYRCSLNDEKTKNYIQNIQHFALWFIDGTKTAQINDPRWQFLLLFEKLPSSKPRNTEMEIEKEQGQEKEKEKEKENNKTTTTTTVKPKEYYFSLLGFLNFYLYNLLGGKQRMRISHYVIFPHLTDPFIDYKFVSQMFKIGLKNDRIVEVTAEDPTPNYQFLRTAYHFKKFLKLKEMIKKTSITHKELLYIKKTLKIPTRQVWICYELINFLNYHISNDKSSNKTKNLLIKTRLENECDDYLIGDISTRSSVEEGGYTKVFELVFQRSKEREQKNK